MRCCCGISLIIARNLSTTRLLKPFAVHDARKPRCTRGRVALQSMPRFGGCVTCQACAELTLDGTTAGHDHAAAPGIKVL